MMVVLMKKTKSRSWKILRQIVEVYKLLTFSIPLPTVFNFLVGTWALAIEIIFLLKQLHFVDLDLEHSFLEGCNEIIFEL